MTGAPRIDFVAFKKYRVDAVDWSADHLPARDARLEEIHCLPLLQKLPRRHAREGGRSGSTGPASISRGHARHGSDFITCKMAKGLDARGLTTPALRLQAAVQIERPLRHVCGAAAVIGGVWDV
ncbi:MULTISPECIES: hypothetical protein [Massilia]|uniref:Uncharacterized protein n=2 Tax=Massilia TaxID=149698 RepID=A0A7X3K7Q8_9BURK|nr:hypothetical protein [Telluria cellulosilytica]MDN4045081.1 hypothetical protein [Massilia sp. YIM B02787]MVW60737.1 hypothetical protein [Telluria cellulosilytica]